MGRPQDKPLIDFLRVNDVPCPRCGYSLHRLRRPYCPECGYGFDLDSLLELRRQTPYIRIMLDDLLEGETAWVVALVVNVFIAIAGIIKRGSGSELVEAVVWFLLLVPMMLWRVAANNDFGMFFRVTRLIGISVWAITGVHLIARVVL